MDDPRYIILVALDTPSTDTGIYISGGVMAAPTVGAVMADILPYLEVTRAQEAIITQVPDLTGLTAGEAERTLEAAGLTGVSVGEGESVTGQLPAAGTAMEAGSQTILYLGESVPADSVSVPDFTGLTPEQAADRAAELGLTLQFAGNPDLKSKRSVLTQDIPADTAVEPGTTVTITLTDPEVRD